MLKKEKTKAVDYIPKSPSKFMLQTICILKVAKAQGISQQIQCRVTSGCFLFLYFIFFPNFFPLRNKPSHYHFLELRIKSFSHIHIVCSPPRLSFYLLSQSYVTVKREMQKRSERKDQCKHRYHNFGGVYVYISFLHLFIYLFLVFWKLFPYLGTYFLLAD